jgi:hypothetical protein
MYLWNIGNTAYICTLQGPKRWKLRLDKKRLLVWMLISKSQTLRIFR